jgi:hypothetical protein
VLSAYYILFKKSFKWKKACIVALMHYLFCLFLGVLTILKSRSSTASIGFLFLPYFAFVPAVLGAAVVESKNKILKFFIFITILAIYFNIASNYVKIKNKNLNSDLKFKSDTIEIEKNNLWIKEVEKLSDTDASLKLYERYQLSQERTISIPIASSLKTPPELLTKLSFHDDLGVVLTVVKNIKTPPEVLERIYTKHPYASYFYSELAANSHTSQKVLLDLFSKKNLNFSIEKNLAKNVNISKILFEKLLESNDPLTLGELARNTKTECVYVNQIFKKLNNMNNEIKFKKTGIGWAIDAYKNCQK